MIMGQKFVIVTGKPSANCSHFSKNGDNMNIPDFMKLKNAWNTFTAGHPKFPRFLNAVRASGIREGTVIGISVTQPDGKVIDTNIRVTAADLELLETLKSFR